MDLGRLGGDRQDLCQTLKNAVQALWGRGFRFSVGLYASGWRWAAFPQGWGLGAGNFNPVFDAEPSSERNTASSVNPLDAWPPGQQRPSPGLLHKEKFSNHSTRGRRFERLLQLFHAAAVADQHEVVAFSLEGKGIFGKVAVTLIKPVLCGNGFTEHGLCGLPGSHLWAGPDINCAQAKVLQPEAYIGGHLPAHDSDTAGVIQAGITGAVAAFGMAQYDNHRAFRPIGIQPTVLQVMGIAQVGDGRALLRPALRYAEQEQQAQDYPLRRAPRPLVYRRKP